MAQLPELRAQIHFFPLHITQSQWLVHGHNTEGTKTILRMCCLHFWKILFILYGCVYYYIKSKFESISYLVNLCICFIINLWELWALSQMLSEPVVVIISYLWPFRMLFIMEAVKNYVQNLQEGFLSSCTLQVMGPNWKHRGIGESKLGSPKRKNTPLHKYPLSCNSIKTSERNS